MQHKLNMLIIHSLFNEENLNENIGYIIFAQNI